MDHTPHPSVCCGTVLSNLHKINICQRNGEVSISPKKGKAAPCSDNPQLKAPSSTAPRLPPSPSRTGLSSSAAPRQLRWLPSQCLLQVEAWLPALKCTAGSELALWISQEQHVLGRGDRVFAAADIQAKADCGHWSQIVPVLGSQGCGLCPRQRNKPSIHLLPKQTSPGAPIA